MDQLTKARSVLLSGGIIIYPTETVYGIGCLLNFPKSIERLYKIKKRDFSKPVAVLVNSQKSAEKFVVFNPAAKKLTNHFWPGPLTICLKAKQNVPETILGTDNTLGIRVPSSKWLIKLLDSLDQPLLAPSANFQGDEPPTKSSQIDKNLSKLVDYVVNIEPDGKKPSTVISFNDGKGYKVIREGAISSESLSQVLLKD